MFFSLACRAIYPSRLFWSEFESCGNISYREMELKIHLKVFFTQIMSLFHNKVQFILRAISPHT